jgi:cytochrome c biogenesis protein CcmG/thiol:disulfide interchange protein DsbE
VRRIAVLVTTLALVGTACSSVSIPIDDVPELPPTTPDDVAAILASSERPVVLNVWASWCAPCRSEAPLFRSAHARYGDEIRFIGIAVDDGQTDARRFIAEFGLNGFEHLFDATGAVPANLGRRGVPLTFFYAPGGELLRAHSGVIDERTLALQVDELRLLGG